MKKAAVYNTGWSHAGGGEKVVAVIAERLACAGWDVTLVGPEIPDIELLQRRLVVDLSKCSATVAKPSFNTITNLLSRIYPRLSRYIYGRLALRFGAKYDLLVYLTQYGVPPICPAETGLLFIQFPHPPDDIVHKDSSGLPLRAADKDKMNRLNSWQFRFCPSDWAQKWTDKRWNVQPTVLYPPSEIGRCRPLDKQNEILTVGRFVASSEIKKQSVMIGAFRQMVDEGLEGWKLTLAGGVHPNSEDIEYLDSLRRMAQGYPIDILTNLTFEEVLPVYGRASIYWHATGCGEDAEKAPQNFEQFGMSVVEAMASGAAPIVFDGGGLKDIVRHKQDGFRWASIDELKSLTYSLIQSPEELRKYQLAANERAKEFSRPAFEAKIDNVIKEIEK